MNAEIKAKKTEGCVRKDGEKGRMKGWTLMNVPKPKRDEVKGAEKGLGGFLVHTPGQDTQLRTQGYRFDLDLGAGDCWIGNCDVALGVVLRCCGLRGALVGCI